MPYVFSNRATAQLARALAPDVTSILVQLGQGGSFPAPNPPEFMQLTIVAVDGTHEIVRCTRRVGDEFTVERAQENTAAGTFAIGSRMELRITSAVLGSFFQVGGGTLQGDLSLGGHAITDAYFPNPTLIDAVHTRAIVPKDGNPTNAIIMPEGGGLPFFNGSYILSRNLLAVCIFPIWTSLENVPPHFKICDGTLGTPDLRRKFIIGVNPGEPALQPGVFGGSFDLNINPVGDHDHGGSTGPHISGSYSLPPLGQSITYALAEIGIPGGTRIVRDVSQPFYGTPTSPHNHQIFPQGFHAHTGSCVPPYMALVYVMLR